MALRVNTITGQLEDDGLPADPSAVAPIEAPVSDFEFGGAAAAGMAPRLATPAPAVAAPPPPAQLPGVNVQVGPATKPLREVETTERVKTDDIAAAERALVSSEQATDKAAAAVSGVAQQEAQITAEGASDRADATVNQLNTAKLDEQDKQARVDANLASDAKAIEEDRQARLAIGNAEHSFWEGRPVAKFFTSILQVIGGVAHGLAGKGGPSEADQALKEQIDAHRSKLVNDWEATKEANGLKKNHRAAHEAERERRAIVANNQSLRELDVIEDQMKARTAALGKDKQAAADQLATAKINEQRRGLRLEQADRYARLQKITDNAYAPGAGAAKPLSSEAKEIVTASAEYERLQVRQEQLLEANHGYPPLGSPDRTEFDTNNKAQVTILQKPLGKSEGDAAAAKDLQNSPGFWTQALNTKGSIERYRSALRVNANRLKKAAETAVSLEGGQVPGGTAPAAAPPAAAPAEVKKLSDGTTWKRTGPGAADWQQVR